MKNLEYYMNLQYRIEIVPDDLEGGYVVHFPELAGCISQGETIEEALENLKDAKRAWLEAAMDDLEVIPEPMSFEDYSGEFKLRMPRSLHKRLADGAKNEGISMNQYCLYLLARNEAMHEYRKYAVKSS